MARYKTDQGPVRGDQGARRAVETSDGAKAKPTPVTPRPIDTDRSDAARSRRIAADMAGAGVGSAVGARPTGPANPKPDKAAKAIEAKIGKGL